MATSSLQANLSTQPNTSQPYIKTHVHLIQITIYIPTFILGLLFNGMAMWFAFHKIKKLTEPVIYMVSLMILDTLVIFALPFKIISYSENPWELGDIFCSFLESLYFVNMYGSILISTCTCVDRYIALLHPFVAVTLRSPKKAAITCAIVSAGVWAGTACTYQFHESRDHTSCFYGFSRTIWNSRALIIILETAFLACLTAMIFCTVQINTSLRKNPWGDDPLTIRSKLVNIIMANLATFTVCFTPFHVALVLYYLVKNHTLDDGQEIIRTFLQISLCWANLNCFLDAISYYFVFKESLKLSSTETNATNVI